MFPLVQTATCAEALRMSETLSPDPATPRAPTGEEFGVFDDLFPALVVIGIIEDDAGDGCVTVEPEGGDCGTGAIGGDRAEDSALGGGALHRTGSAGEERGEGADGGFHVLDSTRTRVR